LVQAKNKESYGWKKLETYSQLYTKLSSNSKRIIYPVMVNGFIKMLTT